MRGVPGVSLRSTQAKRFHACEMSEGCWSRCTVKRRRYGAMRRVQVYRMQGRRVGPPGECRRPELFGCGGLARGRTISGVRTRKVAKRPFMYRLKNALPIRGNIRQYTGAGKPARAELGCLLWSTSPSPCRKHTEPRAPQAGGSPRSPQEGAPDWAFGILPAQPDPTPETVGRSDQECTRDGGEAPKIRSNSPAPCGVLRRRRQ